MFFSVSLSVCNPFYLPCAGFTLGTRLNGFTSMHVLIGNDVEHRKLVFPIITNCPVYTELTQRFLSVQSLFGFTVNRLGFFSCFSYREAFSGNAHDVFNKKLTQKTAAHELQNLPGVKYASIKRSFIVVM